ncbi:MAG: DNA polymerase Y family protein [Armatimonadota bacterium]|nr:DNA polymerase Y family protein [Armatimonadota bacterium]MDR7544025.1 DNA polymerase Y family protein [Armatimonadota bacterium]
MERLACVDIPALPLQIVQEDHPDWRPHPVAVVAEDRPQSPILWANRRARNSGVAPGMIYASALALVPQLRAAPLSPARVAGVVDDIAGRLRAFSPEVEPSPDEPGVFWVNVAGLDRLYASLKAWADAVQADLARMGFTASVAVGFTRFGTYAAARVARGVRVFADPDEERGEAGRVALAHLAVIPPQALAALHQLGVRSVNAFVRLPAEGLLERFGSQLYRLHRMARGDLWTPLQPEVPADPVRRAVLLDDPERDAARVLFLIKRLLHPVLAALAARGQALAACKVRLRPEGQPWREECVRPAAPTLDVVQVLDLVRLRLESVELTSGVVEIELEASGSPAPAEQMRLFTEHRRRDLEAGHRALARLRAELGEGAVVRAVLRRGHLPEACTGWERLERLQVPRPRRVEIRTLVRRVLARPQALPHTSRPSHDDGWLISGVVRGAVADQTGPYMVSGGWWVREVRREYYFVETRRGELLWVYFDRRRRRWFLHGRVE